VVVVSVPLRTCGSTEEGAGRIRAASVVDQWVAAVRSAVAQSYGVGPSTRRRAAATGLSALFAPVAALLTAASFGATPTDPHQHHPQAPAYRERARLLGALPLIRERHVPALGQSATSHIAGPQQGLSIGALFGRQSGRDHFCTASVVTSPGKDLLITAAHCINGGKSGRGYRKGIVFIPDYRDGQEPDGVWTPAKLLVAPQWARSSNPAYDVGFVVLKPRDGKNIQQVLGANSLGTDLHYQYLVHVTGYPDRSAAPITCVNWTERSSNVQLQFDCAGYSGGTSGSPWVIGFSPRSHTGTIVGLIGGYQDGGNKPSVSYSPLLGPTIQRLYRQAEAESRS
jgi:V8-like Glu-specific endopeptidase